MIYQHPLHYLLGLQGTALLRAYYGDRDREFAEARVAEIRRLLDEPGLIGDGAGVDVATVDTVTGYRIWSKTYDQPGNGLFPVEEPFVHEAIDALPAGVALDAACGTGRHTAYLAGKGHRVIGVDTSPDMLATARRRVPDAEFHEADVTALPVPDAHVDVAVCALALAHLPDLKPAFAELARVLRPGGHLVVTDIHHEMVWLGSVPHVRSVEGAAQLIPSYRHRASDYLKAALPVGLTPLRCEEPARGRLPENPLVEKIEIDVWDTWPWSLLDVSSAAGGAAFDGARITMMWHFQRV